MRKAQATNPFRVVSCVVDERSAVGVLEQRGCDRRFVSLASRQFDSEDGVPLDIRQLMAMHAS